MKKNFTLTALLITLGSFHTNFNMENKNKLSDQIDIETGYFTPYLTHNEALSVRLNNNPALFSQKVCNTGHALGAFTFFGLTTIGIGIETFNFLEYIQSYNGIQNIVDQDTIEGIYTIGGATIMMGTSLVVFCGIKYLKKLLK